MRLPAVGYELIYAGYPVLWTPTSTLVQRLLAAKRDLRLPQEVAKLEKFACVISSEKVLPRPTQEGITQPEPVAAVRLDSPCVRGVE